MATVDVIVPCYRYAQYLRACVESALTQEGVGVRVLILDDASPDHTPEVGVELAAADSRVEYRRHQRNVGHIQTYNEGLQWAHGDYVLLLSADDLLVPGALRRATDLMDAHPEVGMTYGNAIRFSTLAPPPVESPVPSPVTRVMSGSGFLELACGRAFCPVATPTAVCRRRLHQELGGYLEHLPHSGDLELWLRFATVSSIGCIEAPQAYYRIHATNMHQEQFASVAGLEQTWAAFAELFRSRSAHLPDAARLERMTRRALAENALGDTYHAFLDGHSMLARNLWEFAEEVCPEAHTLPMYQKLRWMRWTGPRLYTLLRRLAGKPPRRPGSRAPSPTNRRATGPRPS